MNLQRTQIFLKWSNRQYKWNRNKAPFSWRQCLFTNELVSETLPGQRSRESLKPKVRCATICSGTSIWHVESSLENCVGKGWRKNEHPKKDYDCYVSFAQQLYVLFQ